jgi:hypothetical protein
MPHVWLVLTQNSTVKILPVYLTVLVDKVCLKNYNERVEACFKSEPVCDLAFIAIWNPIQSISLCTSRPLATHPLKTSLSPSKRPHTVSFRGELHEPWERRQVARCAPVCDLSCTAAHFEIKKIMDFSKLRKWRGRQTAPQIEIRLKPSTVR